MLRMIMKVVLSLSLLLVAYAFRLKVSNMKRAVVLRSSILQNLESLIGFGKSPRSADGNTMPSMVESDEITKRYSEVIKIINNLEDKYENLSDVELRAKTNYFKGLIRAGASLDTILPDAFALVREASWRVLEQRHFDVQLLAGVALYNKFLIEMATGEGKTLVAILPAYLYALSGKSSFVVTSNDYLSRRDGETVGQVLKFLGITVGIVQTDQSEEVKRIAYTSDVTYVSNQALGFDFLRDNLVISKDNLVLSKPLGFCIVDEADSILIDEARTPLIISRKMTSITTKYLDSSKVAKNMAKTVHYDVDEKQQKISITSAGYDFIRQLIGKNPFDLNDPWTFYILNALRAKELLLKDRQYIVQNNEISIIDDFSGRVLTGRKFTDGLQQAIEAKENVPISAPTQCIAKISYQSLFRLFPVLSGMTGTAATDATEFQSIYNLTVAKIPSALPIARRDYPDAVFRTKAGKMKTMLKNIVSVHQKGRPVLIGTTSIESSDEIFRALKDLGIGAKLLNARPENIEKENEVIAQAGSVGSVTVATNLAGRGTDIVLGGNKKELSKSLLKNLLFIIGGYEKDFCGVFNEKSSTPKSERLLSLTNHLGINFPYPPTEESAEILLVATKQCHAQKQFASKLDITTFVSESIDGVLEKEGEEEDEFKTIIGEFMSQYDSFFESERAKVIKLGGLYVIGTARHESRRIDNQLRGRSGRQGDPGASRFFLSLDDDLFRVFGGNKLTGLMENFKVAEEMPIESDLVTQALDKVQVQVESNLRALREELFRLDDFVATQRNDIYGKRRYILDAGDKEMEELFLNYCKATMREIGEKIVTSNGATSNDGESLAYQYFPNIKLDESILRSKDKNKILTHLDARVGIAVEEKIQEISSKSSWIFSSFFKYMTLVQIDEAWGKYLTRLDMLKEELSLQGYGGENNDPYQFFTEKSTSLFSTLLADVRRNSIYSVFVYKPSKEKPQSPSK